MSQCEVECECGEARQCEVGCECGISVSFECECGFIAYEKFKTIAPIKAHS